MTKRAADVPPASAGEQGRTRKSKSANAAVAKACSAFIRGPSLPLQ